MTVPVIETPRLRLRGHQLRDFPHCMAIWSDPSVMRYLGGKPLCTEDVWSKFLRYSGHWAMLGYGFWAVEEKSTGAYVGEMGLGEFRREIVPPLESIPEAGWVLASAAHGRGYATEVMQQVLDWAARFLSVPRTHCIVHPENAASLRVARKCGYEETRRTTYKGQPAVVLVR